MAYSPGLTSTAVVVAEAVATTMVMTMMVTMMAVIVVVTDKYLEAIKGLPYGSTPRREGR